MTRTRELLARDGERLGSGTVLRVHGHRRGHDVDPRPYKYHACEDCPECNGEGFVSKYIIRRNRMSYIDVIAICNGGGVHTSDSDPEELLASAVVARAVKDGDQEWFLRATFPERGDLDPAVWCELAGVDPGTILPGFDRVESVG